MHTKHVIAGLTLLFALLDSRPSGAQTPFSEDFTGATTTNTWYFVNGACLTAGTSTTLVSPASVPACTSVLSSYYALAHDSDTSLVGGDSGYLGSSTAPASIAAQAPDTVGAGALRFTNGRPFGHNESGAIISQSTFDTSQGIQVTFKTVTYRGDSGGAGKDGADGMSFFLLDGSVNPGIGAFGGSLAYSCSNSNFPFNGIIGGYIGLGIDEFGNFLNGTSLMAGYTGSNTATGDNTALGYGYKPGRIGMRGAGSIAWNALTAAYGTNPNDTTKPYYPATLATTCSNGGLYTASTDSCGPVCTTGTYNSGANTCDICATGTFYSATNKCNSCNSAATYNSATGTCSPVATCASGTYDVPSNSCLPQCATGSYDSASNKCDVCPAGDTFDTTHSTNASTKPCAKCTLSGVYNSTNGTCSLGVLSWVAPSTSTSPAPAPVATLVATNPTTASPVTGAPYYHSAVQKTCKTGELYNYASAGSPIDVGSATIANTVNTAKILDYAPIPNAYKELSGVQIANESAVVRTDGTPIFYNLKITKFGLLSLSYSISGGAYLPVISNQDITAANGTLPATFRFGFAGSTGGDTNVHEIMCFKAASANTSGSSATVNEKESAKVETTTQAFFAFYNPNDWTGTVTANTLIDNAGVVSVSGTANWDAQCLLTGTSTGLPSAGGGCISTNAAGPTTASPTPTSRVMLTWDYTAAVGVPFEWTGGINTGEQNTLDALDASQTANRLNYLRGDRSNEITTAGSGLYRARDGVLGDIVDSSPTWVGPPILPYTATWTDRLQSADVMVENSGTQNYLQYVSAETQRLNVVYVGANDGFLHGFEAGALDSNGVLINNSTTPNDGKEVLAYMPGSVLASAAKSNGTTPCSVNDQTQSVVQNIHGVTPATGAYALCVTGDLDYSNFQYGHNFFVDATPGTGDLFYGGTWHTWLVGGLGAGGAAIYALDITNPGNFNENNASSLVLGEWNSATPACAPCASNLGNTFGTPQIRRLHNGQWGVIFGNGIGSASGDAGIFVMVINDQGAGNLPTETFYYLSTGHAGSNGITYVTAADLDGDHITDYVYAGDLQGNVWRFDLTNSDPTQWAASSAPLFTTPGQPITSQLLVIATNVTGGPQRLMIEFATGQRVQLTNTAAVSYAAGTQAIYGIWDWNMGAWDSMSGTQYASLAPAATGLSSPYTIPSSGTPISGLAQQTFTINTSAGVLGGIREGTNVAVCWMGSTTCTSGNTQFGWYANLPGTSEQVIYNPVFFQGAILVDSTVPANNIPTGCTTNLDTGFTYAISVANGGVFTSAFPTYRKNGTLAPDPLAAGVETDATGSVYVVTTVQRTSNIIYQTVSGTPSSQEVNIPPNTKSKRLTWVERR